MQENFPDLQPELENELLVLSPLQETDYDALYSVASDPLLWEQHPNRDRYKPERFQNFFQGALESKAAFLVKSKADDKVIGTSRYYDWSPEQRSIAVGYTFIARSHWGGIFNPALKKLMLDHAFTFADRVIFHVGAVNLRSQKAVERLGATKIAEEEIAYYGEEVRLNFVYELAKKDWLK